MYMLCRLLKSKLSTTKARYVYELVASVLINLLKLLNKWQ